MQPTLILIGLEHGINSLIFFYVFPFVLLSKDCGNPLLLKYSGVRAFQKKMEDRLIHPYSAIRPLLLSCKSRLRNGMVKR